ncbi:MAG: hypothetical protein AAB440_03335 [Patescibacteria group bacterium]
MALSPTIPTSFVPKQPVRPTAPRSRASGANLFLVISFFLLGAAVVGSVLVFAYQQYLKSVITEKETQLQTAEEEINFATVEEYIRVRDRFTAAQELLDEHVTLSQFLSVLEKSTLANVRFSTFTFILSDEGVPTIEMNGIARNFNALAAQSNAFGADTRIKSAIFSDITVNANNSVSFHVSAQLSPALLMMMDPSERPVPEVPSLPVATTTPSAGTSTSSPVTGTSTAPVAPVSPASTSSPVGL